MRPITQKVSKRQFGFAKHKKQIIELLRNEGCKDFRNSSTIYYF